MAGGTADKVLVFRECHSHNTSYGRSDNALRGGSAGTRAGPCGGPARAAAVRQDDPRARTCSQTRRRCASLRPRAPSGRGGAPQPAVGDRAAPWPRGDRRGAAVARTLPRPAGAPRPVGYAGTVPATRQRVTAPRAGRDGVAGRAGGIRGHAGFFPRRRRPDRRADALAPRRVSPLVPCGRRRGELRLAKRFSPQLHRA